MSVRDRLTRRGNDEKAELRTHVKDLEEQVIRLQARLDRVQGGHRKLRERAQDQAGRLKALRAAITPVTRADNLRELDHQRAMQQLAVLEQRVGRLEERLEGDRYAADDEALRQARSLVDTVRREHDQVRVRMQVVSAYEERLRRLEATVTDLYEGDQRHPI